MNLKLRVKIKNIRNLYRGVRDFRKGNQPRTNIVKDEKDDVVIDCHSILARWRNHFSQLFNVHGVSGVRGIHTAEPLVPEQGAFQFEKAIEKLKKHTQITRYLSNPSRFD